jgi:antitoxin (DNA-binding transcriptional repressor) of toxin-antitoxin stability system
MKTVGIRELKDRLSEYLREVRRGESVLVTDRGEVIAEVSPPGQLRTDPSVPAGLRELARRGLATLGSPSKASVYEALPRRRRGKMSAAQLLEEERGKR